MGAPLGRGARGDGTLRALTTREQEPFGLAPVLEESVR